MVALNFVAITLYLIIRFSKRQPFNAKNFDTNSNSFNLNDLFYQYTTLIKIQGFELGSKGISHY